MTTLATRKTRLIFTTADEIRERGKFRPVVIEARPGCAVVRLLGLRTAYTITYGAIYHCAAKAAANAARAEKKAQSKKERK
jgi:hypothetical protein